MSGLQAPRDEAWEAMTSGDYEVALSLYEQKSTAEPRSVPWLNNKANALLCLERYEDARNTLSDVQRQYENTQAPYSGRAELAVATWLCGDQANAVEILKTELSAIEDGRTGYLDHGFGVNEGAILYYFGAVAGDQSVTQRACRYLRDLSAKPLGTSWPPGLLAYLIGESTEATTQAIIRRDAVDSNANEWARAILVPKAQMKFDFCRAMKLHVCDRAQALAHYSEIARRPNPILLSEWYLARAEAKGK